MCAGARTRARVRHTKPPARPLIRAPAMIALSNPAVPDAVDSYEILFVLLGDLRIRIRRRDEVPVAGPGADEARLWADVEEKRGRARRRSTARRAGPLLGGHLPHVGCVASCTFRPHTSWCMLYREQGFFSSNSNRMYTANSDD